MKLSQVGIQLYTVRDASKQDFRATLERVAEVGYQNVELAGLYDLSPAALAKTLQDLGLRCISAHVPLSELKDNLLATIEAYQTIGLEYLICPWLPPELRGDEAGYRALAADLNHIGAECRANGLGFCYHHHDFEMVQFKGKHALDILLQDSDPTNVQLQPDLYWLKFAGVEPASYVRKWAGRISLVHLKDMTATDPPTFAEVGNGIMDWPELIQASEESGATWFIVEQDTCLGDPFDSIELSLNNLKALSG